MKNGWPIGMLAVLLAVSAAGCRRDNKAEQLAALDNAYQAGVVTKGEYDAKRLALMGTPPAPHPAAPHPAAPPLPAGPAPAAIPAPAQNPVADAAPPVASPPTAPRQVAPAQAATQPPSPPQPAQPTAQPTPPPVESAAPPAVEAKPRPQSNVEESDPAPLAGCADAEYKSGKENGAQQRFFAAPIESVRKAAGDALRSLDFAVHLDAGNRMEASKRRHIGAIIGAGGERLSLRFETSRQGGHTGTLVWGETKKSFMGRLAQKSWTNAVLAQIACHLRGH